MNLVVLSGSGISAESGIATFRGNGGLWEGFPVHEVASPEAWELDPERVLRFYNERRRRILSAIPNAGHLALASLEKYFNVVIITQNVDDLHERAGSANILHLHGEIRKARSTKNPDEIYEIAGTELNLGEVGADGYPLRPHIVWFGEHVTAIPEAEAICQQADIMIVTGTSLQVYPANLLVYEAPPTCPIYVVDPSAPSIESSHHQIEYIQKPASIGLPALADRLMSLYNS